VLLFLNSPHSDTELGPSPPKTWPPHQRLRFPRFLGLYPHLRLHRDHHRPRHQLPTLSRLNMRRSRPLPCPSLTTSRIDSPPKPLQHHQPLGAALRNEAFKNQPRPPIVGFLLLICSLQTLECICSLRCCHRCCHWSIIRANLPRPALAIVDQKN
jgi:hypothetical protein